MLFRSGHTFNEAVYIPGVMNDDAKHIFTNGQCMALAVTTAEEHARRQAGQGRDSRVDWNSAQVVVVWAKSDDQDQPNVHHVWADIDGVLIDAEGDNSMSNLEEELEDEYREHEQDMDWGRTTEPPIEKWTEVMTTTEARSVAQQMQEQNYTFAMTFADGLLAEERG